MAMISCSTEFKDLVGALKNMLMCLSYSKVATIRGKIMKIIKKLIKCDPSQLKDRDIQQILKLRITDVSSMTREGALDIIHRNLDQIVNEPILMEYMGMVIDRAHRDTNLTVRKKVIQILSQVLNNTGTLLPLKQKIIKILISKWADATVSVKQSLVSSIQKILKV